MRNTQSGYVTLLSVIILGAIAITITLSVILFGVSGSLSTLANQQATKARTLAGACVEEALEQVRESTSYTGTGSLTTGDGTCSYTVTNTGGETRTITASSTASSVTRRISASVQSIGSQITLTSWKETAD